MSEDDNTKNDRPPVITGEEDANADLSAHVNDVDRARWESGPMFKPGEVDAILSPGQGASVIPGEEDMTPAERKRAARMREAKEKRDAQRFAARAKATAQADHLRSQGYEIDGAETSDHHGTARIMETTTREPMVPVVFLYEEREGEISQEERDAFIEHVSRSGNWNQAGYSIGRTGASFRRLAKSDPFFAAQIGEALQDFREYVLGEVLHRAVNGVAKPVFAGKDGDLVGHIIEKSDMLLALMAKAVDPRRFGGNPAVLVNNNNVDNRVGVMVVPGVAATKEEWEANRDAVDAQRRTLQPLTGGLKRKPSNA